MKALTRYTTVAGLVVLGVLAASWMALDPPGRRGVALAAGVTFPLQVILFALLVRARHDQMSFLGWWAAGILGRMGVVAVLGLVVRTAASLDPSATVLSAAGLLFVMLLLEPACLDGLGRASPTSSG